MGIIVDIQKNLGDFRLDVAIRSDSRRIGILGESGSGKSMTLRCIAGIENPDSGIISVDGQNFYYNLSSRPVDSEAQSEERVNIKPQRRRVGVMFQNYALFPTMTVRQNIAAGLGASHAVKRSKDAISQRVEEMLTKFNLNGLGDRFPSELSGGQQQRVALARIMAYEPEIIMLDEPFSALDSYLKDRLQLELQNMLADYQGQVIMVSHDRDEIYRFSEEVFVLSDGKVVASGNTREVFANPSCIEVAKLTGCKNFSRARKLDENRVIAVDWGIELDLSEDNIDSDMGFRTIADDIQHVGYRAHYFVPIWGEPVKNCISFNLAGMDELPFEHKYYIRTDAEESSLPDIEDDPNKANHRPETLISWFVQGKEQELIAELGLPDYLRLLPSEIMLLK